MRPSVLLWDFGDTLVDERWMRRPPEECPTWETAWDAVAAESAADWDVGRRTGSEVFNALASRTGMTTERVEAHARACCRQLVFNPAAWQVARERRLPQALVTVNPDLFVDFVVAEHQLPSVFDTIVVSSVEGTADKTELCIRALARLGFEESRSRALLIDNRLDLVEAWRRAGGSGYWFQTDDQFARDTPDLFG